MIKLYKMFNMFHKTNNNMKRIGIIMSFVFMLGMMLSCTKTESQFIDEKTPNERYSEFITEVRSILQSSEYGWIGMLRTPRNDKGFSVFIDFKEDNRVVMYSDFNTTTSSTPKESSFGFRNTGIPSLIFDTYNYIHLLADPNSDVNSGTSGSGLYADFEFSIRKVSADTIVLRGNLNNNDFLLVRLKQDEKDKLVNGVLTDDINLFQNYFASAENNYIELNIDGESRKLAIDYVDNRGVAFQVMEGSKIVSFAGPLYYALNEIKLGKENTYKGVTFVRAYFKEVDKLFIVDDAGKEYEVLAASSPIIPLPPFLDSFGDGKRYYSAEFRPNTANVYFQPIWNAIQNESITKADRHIGYLRMSLLADGQLYIRIYRYAAGAGTTGSASYSRLYFNSVNNNDGSVSYVYTANGSDGGASSSALRSTSLELEAFLRDNKFVWDWKNKTMTEGEKTGVALTGILGTS
jgi:hypothetical protein